MKSNMNSDHGNQMTKVVLMVDLGWYALRSGSEFFERIKPIFSTASVLSSASCRRRGRYPRSFWKLIMYVEIIWQVWNNGRKCKDVSNKRFV